MPLKAGGSRATISQNIRELHTGKTYAHTASKFGKDRANKQAIAIALSTARKYKADGGGLDVPLQIDPQAESDLNARLRVNAMKPAGPQPMSTDEFLRQRRIDQMAGPQVRIRDVRAEGGGLPNPFEDVDKYVPQPLTGPTTQSDALKFWRYTPKTKVIPIREHASGGRANETKPAHLGPGYLSRMAFGGLPAPKPPGLSKPVALGAAYKPPKVDLNPSEGIERMTMRGSLMGLRREGMINSNIPGRTDKLPMNVKAGSYVLPADIPSALGQGNSMAGGQILKKMFSSGPYGLPTMHGTGRVNMPRMQFVKPPSMGMSSRYNTGFAEGGTKHEQSGGDESADHVPIIAAGGEYIIDPSVVRDIGHGNIKAGHRVLDQFVLSTRKKHIETLKKLKPPKK